MAAVLVLWLQRVVEHLQSSGLVVFCKIPAERQEKLQDTSDRTYTIHQLYTCAYVDYALSIIKSNLR